MDNGNFQKRIIATEFDTYPLDRLLSLETVYSIFLNEYKKSNDKNLFFRDRKYQKMREGYAALFVAASHQENSHKEHFLVFPSDPANDFYTVEKGEEIFKAIEFDLKEFTNFSGSFEEFVKDKIVPKLETYNLAITSYRDIDGFQLEVLIDALKATDRNIWVLTAPGPEDTRTSASRITVVNKSGIIYDNIIDLEEYLDMSKQPMVYQDVIRFKPYKK